MVDKISIIVPIYNVEKWIERCIKGLVNQDYSNLEILLVNDGSTDNSAEICKKYAKLYNNVFLLNKKNGGLSDARNFGITHSSGRYLAFVDSDDYVAKNYISSMYQALIDQGATMAMCGFSKVDEKGKILETVATHSLFNGKNISGRDVLTVLPQKDGILGVVAWNKLYRREIFHKILFKNGKLHEDEFIVAPLLYNINKIAIVDKNLYFYVQRKGSIMSLSANDKSIINASEAFEERLQFYKQRSDIPLYYLTIEQYRLWILSQMKYFNFFSKNKVLDYLQEHYSKLVSSNECNESTFFLKIQNKIGKKNIRIAWLVGYIFPKVIEKIKGQ